MKEEAWLKRLALHRKPFHCDKVKRVAPVSAARPATYIGRMKTPLLIPVAVLLALSQVAVAELVPVQWDAAGHFSKEVPVQPGKFIEVCEKLPEGAKVDWSFMAAGPVDFNIHYHEGKEVRFPAKKAQVAQDEGALTTTLKQTYCWMWTNKGVTPLNLQFKLAKT